MKKTPKKKEQFKVIRESAATRNWNTYLDLQVKLFAKNEFELFARHGLPLKHPVLDLGCGPGLYSRALRKWSPSTPIVAVDTNQALLDRFRAALAKKPDAKIDIHHWSAGTGTPPTAIKKCKAAILRYVLQHTHDPVAVLKSVARTLPKGALIFIVEEDDGLYQFEPEFPAFRKLIDVWDRWAKEYGGDRQIGRKIPHIAAEAGLEVKDVQVICHTHYEPGLDPLLDYFMLSFGIVCETSPKVLSKAEAARLTKEFKKYRDAAGKNCFFFYPQVITIAKVV